MQSVFSPIESIGLHLAKPERPNFPFNLLTQAGQILRRTFFPPKGPLLVQDGKVLIPSPYNDIHKDPSLVFPKQQAEVLAINNESHEELETRQYIYSKFLDVCKNFYDADAGISNPALPIRAIKRPDKTYRFQTPKDVFLPSLKTNQPDFDSSIGIILNSDEETFTTALLILELSNPGFCSSKSDPGGIYPEIVTQANGSHDITTKVISDQSPEAIKTYIQKLREAIAVRLADRSIYEGMLTPQQDCLHQYQESLTKLNQPTNKSLITGPEGIGKSTIAKTLSESLHINSLTLNSPNKILNTLNSPPALNPKNQIIEAPAFLIDPPHQNHEYSKLHSLVDKIGRAMGLKDCSQLRAQKEIFLSKNGINSSLTYSLAALKRIRTLIFPIDLNTDVLLTGDYKREDPTPFNTLHPLIASLPDDILNTLMLAVVFGVPNVLLISPFEPANLSPRKKLIFERLYSKQTSMIKNQGGDQDFSDLMAFLSPNYINIINNIENQFPMPSRAKTLFLNLIKQLGAFEAINSPIEEI